MSSSPLEGRTIPERTVVDGASVAHVADDEWDRDVARSCIVLSAHPARLTQTAATIQNLRRNLKNPPPSLTLTEKIAFTAMATGLLLAVLREQSVIAKAAFMFCAVALMCTIARVAGMHHSRLRREMDDALAWIHQDLSWVPKSELENLLHATAQRSHLRISDEVVTRFLEHSSTQRDRWVCAYYDVVCEGGEAVLHPLLHGGSRPQQQQEFQLRRGVVDHLIGISARA